MSNIQNTSQLDPIDYWDNLVNTDYYSRGFSEHKFENELQLNRFYIDKYQRLISLLETPLELKHFLPLDEEGNVLEEPKSCKSNCDQGDYHENGKCWQNGCVQEMRAYNKAMESVLFDGCYLEDFKGSSRLVYNGLHFAEINNGETLFFYNSIKDIIHVPIPVTEQLNKLC